MYQQAETAFRAIYLDIPAKEATGKFADIALKFLEALEPVKNGTVRVGDIIIVKVTHQDKNFIRLERITPELARELAGNPMLLKYPEDLMKFLENQQQSPESILDRETSEETPVHR
jgi:hypothetical protein